MRRGVSLWRLMLALLVVGGSLVVFLILILRSTGSAIVLDTLDNWIFQQVLGITQTYFVPTISVDDFQYDAPYTFVMHSVAFDAPSSSPGDTSTRVLTADNLTLTLAQTPSVGQPIRIEDITLTNTTLLLLRDTANQKVVFKGLLPFAKTDNIKNQDNVEQMARLSEILRIQTITLENFTLEYDPGTGDPPMILQGLDMTLEATQTLEENGRIWHLLECHINRAPLLTIKLAGRIDLDTFEVELSPSTIAMALDDQTRSILPPELQELALKHDLHGGVNVDLQGTILGSDIPSSTLLATITLDDLNVSIDKYRIPISTGILTATLEEGLLTCDPLSLDFLEGNLSAQAQMDMKRPDWPATLDWSIADMRLESFLRTDITSDNPSDLSGRISSTGSASLNVNDGLPSLAGSGVLDFDEGKLVAIPGLTDIISIVRSSTGWRAQGADTLHAEFTLAGQGVHLDTFKYVTDVLSADGSGWLYFDETLDLQIAGGPVKALTGRLGIFGKILEEVTSNSLRYEIRGTFDEPEVSLKPFGF